MTPPLILIVSGSRTLATRPGGEAWARAQIAEVVATMDPADGILATGDARGPDAWGIEAATEHLMTWRRFCLDGRIEGSDLFVDRWIMVTGLEPDPRRRPLQRNREMIAAYAGDYAYTNTVVLGLVDPASRTHGTDLTIAAARKGGMKIDRRVCP
jgi:hypothetical protein